MSPPPVLIGPIPNTAEYVSYAVLDYTSIMRKAGW